MSDLAVVYSLKQTRLHTEQNWNSLLFLAPVWRSMLEKPERATMPLEPFGPAMPKKHRKSRLGPPALGAQLQSPNIIWRSVKCESEWPFSSSFWLFSGSYLSGRSSYARLRLFLGISDPERPEWPCSSLGGKVSTKPWPSWTALRLQLLSKESSCIQRAQHVGVPLRSHLHTSLQERLPWLRCGRTPRLVCVTWWALVREFRQFLPNDLGRFRAISGNLEAIVRQCQAS